MTDKKLSMADRIFYEKEIKAAQEKKKNAEIAAETYANSLIESFNKKKIEQQEKEREDEQERERKILIEKLNNCDWNDSKETSKVIEQFLKFFNDESKTIIGDEERKEIIDAFEWLIDRAKIIEAGCMLDFVKSYEWNLYDCINFETFEKALDKCEMTEEIIYRLIIQWWYIIFKEHWIDQHPAFKEANARAFERFKTFLEKGCEIDDEDDEEPEFLFFNKWPIFYWMDTSILYDHYSECWELDEEILYLLLNLWADIWADIWEDDYKYFRWIEKWEFMQILHDREEEEVEEECENDEERYDLYDRDEELRKLYS